MAEALANVIAFVGIDIGKNSFHVVGLDRSGAIVLRQKWSRGQVKARFATCCCPAWLARVGAQHLSRRLTALGHDARLRRNWLTGNKVKIGLKHNDQVDLFARDLRPHLKTRGDCKRER